MTPQERQSVSELFDRLAQLENTPRDAEAERAIADGLMRAPHAVYALVQTTLVQDEALRRADARIRELSSNAEPRANRSFFESMRTAVSGSSPHTSVPSVRPPANQPDARCNRGGAMAAAAPSDNNPRNSERARDAGLNDIGSDRQAGLFDSGDADNGDSADFGGDLGGGFCGGDSAEWLFPLLPIYAEINSRAELNHHNFGADLHALVEVNDVHIARISKVLAHDDNRQRPAP